MAIPIYDRLVSQTYLPARDQPNTWVATKTYKRTDGTTYTVVKHHKREPQSPSSASSLREGVRLFAVIATITALCLSILPEGAYLFKTLTESDWSWTQDLPGLADALLQNCQTVMKQGLPRN